MATVALVKCPDYEPSRVEDAVRRAVEMVPGFRDAVAAAGTTHLKINLTQLYPLEKAVTTHPAVVRAAGKIFQELGARVTIGEGSGGSGWPLWRKINKVLFEKLANHLRGKRFEEIEEFHYYLTDIRYFSEIFKQDLPGLVQPFTNLAELGVDTEIDFYGACGVLDTAGEIGAELAYYDLEDVVTVRTNAGRFLPFVDISRSVYESGRVVSLAKFKTHADAIITGAIKNFFGIIPTPMRHIYHGASKLGGMMPEMLVDVFSSVRPAPFAITDAVVGLEGEGPLEGTPRRMGLIIASCDCVAHDAVQAALVGVDPMDVPAVRIACEQGLGEGRLDHIDVRGCAIEEVRQTDWDLERNNGIRKKFHDSNMSLS